MQRLIMPFKKQMMLCGYRNAEYQKHWGYPHYGVDISTIQGGAGTDHNVYASGNGVVLLAGWDEKLGGAICVMYSGAYNHKTGKTTDVVARYMHLASVAVKTGDAVKTGTVLGVEGKEGTGDYHLHLEFDIDVKYPQYSPQVAGSTFWKKGTDSTVNPSYLLHINDDRKVVTPTYNPAWLNKEDIAIPPVPVELNYKALYTEAKAKLDAIAEILKGD